MHCNTVIQYKPSECTLSKLVFSVFNFDVFFMFRTVGFICRKTAVYTVTVQYGTVRYGTVRYGTVRYGTLYIHQYK